ncbi:MAG: serine hydrolase domain-containing protein [Pseudomonadota bacterium]
MSQPIFSADNPYRAPEADFTVADLEARGVVPERLERLLSRAGQEVEQELLGAVQVALAKDGVVVCLRSFGQAVSTSLFSIFSATKAITSALVWQLLERGDLKLEDPVVRFIPEFGTNGKEAVTVLHLLTHTAGFPLAPFRPLDWDDRERRLGRFAQWRLTWPPGSQFEYHPTATMWVLAELIERVGGADFRDQLRQRVLDPLGLPRFYVGRVPASETGILDCEAVGEPLTGEDYARLGMPEPPAGEVTDEVILNFNRPEVRAVGVPGGGGVCGAGELALFYQALLPGGTAETIVDPALLKQARTVHSGELRDPLFRKLANRGLGLVVAGDRERTFRGFGKSCSEVTFGHNGAGGQLAWADPTTGLSLAYLTSGHDRNPVRQASRGVAISSLAADCTRPL